MKMQLSKKKSYVLLLMIIILQLGVTTYLFATQKDGYHSDETFSFGLSNSYYQPYFGIPGDAEDLHSTAFSLSEDGFPHVDLEATGLIDCYQWIPGSKYRDYLTVQPDQRFAYDSVFYNQSLDLHPPLYYLLLHTICSFFPNSFSAWYAYSLNILFLTGTQIFLYLCALHTSRSRSTALLCCLLYGCSVGAQCTFLFLRQYALQTMLCMLFTYLAVKIHNKSDWIRDYIFTLIIITLVAFLAFMAQLFSIVYIGIFTALYCLDLLLHRHWKKMFYFGISMLIALSGFLLAWSHVFFQHSSYAGYTQGGMFSHRIRFRMLLRILCRYCFGFSIRVLNSNWAVVVLPPLLFLCIFVPLLLLPFRDEAWCIRLFSRIRNVPGCVKHFAVTADFITLIIAGSALSVYVATSLNVDVVLMGDYVIRYIMLTLPLLCMVAVIWLCKALALIPRITRFRYAVTLAVIIAALVRSYAITYQPFLMTGFDKSCDDANQLLQDKNVLFIYDRYPNTFRYSNWCAPYLSSAKNIFLTSSDLMIYYRDEIMQLNEPIDYAVVCYDNINFTDENSRIADEIMENYKSSPYYTYSALEAFDVTDDFTQEQYDELVEPLLASAREASETDSLFSSSGVPSNSVTVDCSFMIEALNGGCEYKVIGGLNIQGILFFILELE